MTDETPDSRGPSQKMIDATIRIDTSFEKYPPLPVQDCSAYERSPRPTSDEVDDGH